MPCVYATLPTALQFFGRLLKQFLVSRVLEALVRMRYINRRLHYIKCWTQAQKGPGLNRSRDVVG